MTPQEIQRANEVLAADPAVQAALANIKGARVDRFGAARLQGEVLKAGAKALKGAGIQLDDTQRVGGGSGELEYRDWMTRNWSSKVLPAIVIGVAAAPFAAAAIGGAGAAGGTAGGAGAGGAGAAGTAGSLSPLASGALPGATGSSLFGGAAAGGGAAGAGGAAASLSPVGASLASGALPAATGSSLFAGGAVPGAAAAGGGGGMWGKLLDAAGSDGASNVVGGIASGRAEGEKNDNTALTQAMNARILAEQQVRKNAGEDTDLAKRADIINNIQDVTSTHPRANIVHFQGGLRPSLFGAGTKEAATLAGGQALDRLRNPSDLLNPANFPDPNRGSVVDKALEVAGPATAIANLIRRRRGTP